MKTIKEIDSAVVSTFSDQLRGTIVLPSDDSYEETRKVYNGMIDKRPGMFVMCVDVADVMAAVNFSRENNLLVAVITVVD